MERGGCIESALATGTERRFVYLFDGRTGEVKTIPKKPVGFGFTQPMLVECIESIALACPRVVLKKGVGVKKVVKDDELGICVHLEDGTVISATHLIGADGKWSNVRQSSQPLNSQARIVTCPSFDGDHMNSPTLPKGFKTDGTYIINPPKECMFYIIALLAHLEVCLSLWYVTMKLYRGIPGLNQHLMRSLEITLKEPGMISILHCLTLWNGRNSYRSSCRIFSVMNCLNFSS